MGQSGLFTHARERSASKKEGIMSKKKKQDSYALVCTLDFGSFVKDRIYVVVDKLPDGVWIVKDNRGYPCRVTSAVRSKHFRPL